MTLILAAAEGFSLWEDDAPKIGMKVAVVCIFAALLVVMAFISSSNVKVCVPFNLYYTFVVVIKCCCPINTIF